MIEAQHLTRRFGTLVAVDDVSFSVRRGEAVGFLGPNGAGKTTTFRMLTGIVGPSSGSVRIGGHDIADEPILAKRRLGYMPENAPLYPEMTVREFLHFRAELRGISSRSQRRACTDAALERTHCRGVAGTLIGHLSKGFRQRVALAEVLLASPPVLLLDEPTAGLDPNQVAEVRKLIVELAEDHAVLVSTHVLSEVEATCDRAIVLHQGRMVAEGPLAELKGALRLGAYVIARGSKPQLASALLHVKEKGVTVKSEGAGRCRLHSSEPDALTTLIDLARGHDLAIEEAGQERAALDEVFQALTRGEP